MALIVPMAIVVAVLVMVIITILLGALVICVGRVDETNKQLMILVAGKEEKPESALRALVALNKPPQGKLKGIADGKKEDKESTNIDYRMTIGV